MCCATKRDFKAMVKNIVFHVSSARAIGGGERIAVALSRGLKDTYDFMILAPAGDYFRECNQRGYRTCSLGSGAFFSSIKNLYVLVVQYKPSIIHCHGTRAAVWGRLVLILIRKSHRPCLVYTVHGFHAARTRTLKARITLLLEHFLNRWADSIVAVSPSDKKELIRHYGSGKIRRIANGISLLSKSSGENYSSQESGRLIVGSIARLEFPKDFTTLIHAFKLVLKVNPKAELHIVGSGSLEGDIRKQIRECGLGRAVFLLGFQSDIASFLSRCDVIVLSSRWEGMPLVLLEAGMASRPVIGSNVPGICDSILDGETGFFFRFGDPQDLADKICNFSNVECCRVMGQNNYAYISKNFSEQTMLQKYADLYTDMLRQMALSQENQ